MGWRDRNLQRRLARSALLALLVLALVGGGVLLVGLFQIRSALEAARAELGEVRVAISDVEVHEASAAVAAADEELARARSWTENRLWSMAGALPVVGRSLDMTGDVVEVGSAAVDVARIAVSDGERLLVEGLDFGIDGGRIDLSPVLATRELVERLPVDRLRIARDALATRRRGWIPAELLDGRAQTLALADEALLAIDRAQALTTALPGFLGADGERRYFVGVQTSAELRGTGGLIGYFGILTVGDGVLSFGRSEATDPSEALRSSDGTGSTALDTTYYGSLAADDEVEAIAAEPAFAARYRGVAATSNFANVNVDPHLPSTARVILDLFASRTGEELDGVILLDTVGLERLLAATGPELSIDDEVAASLGLDGAVPTDRFAELTTFEVYEELGREHTEERRLALRTLGDAAFAQVVAGGWDGTDMVRAVSDAGDARNLQVFSERPEEQEAFTDIGITGSLPSDPDSDAIALVANNAVGGKQDVHLGHEFALKIRLSDVDQGADGSFSATRSTALQVTVDNPLPSSGMDEYIIGNCVRPEGPNVCFGGEPGWNWTWFTAFLPAGTDLLDARSDEVSQSVSEYGSYHGFHLVDHFQGTPPRSRGSFELDLEGRVPLQHTDDAIVYELLWWRQAKSIPDLLDVSVTPPRGWRLADLEVSGGGDGRGSGVHGAGLDLEAEVIDGVAYLSGTVTEDVRLRLHLVAADR